MKHNPKGSNKPKAAQAPNKTKATQAAQADSDEDEIPDPHAEYKALKDSMSPEERREYLNSIKQVSKMDKNFASYGEREKEAKEKRLSDAKKRLAEKQKAAETGQKIDK